MKGKRIMLKLSASEKSVSLRTVSKGFRSPHRFIVLDQELEELEAKRHIIVSDIHSFAEMQLDKAEMGDGENLDGYVYMAERCRQQEGFRNGRKAPLSLSETFGRDRRKPKPERDGLQAAVDGG